MDWVQAPRLVSAVMWKTGCRTTHLALASLTRIRGRWRSSFSRWLCSVRRRSLSSDIDCLCGRLFIFAGGCSGKRTSRPVCYLAVGRCGVVADAVLRRSDEHSRRVSVCCMYVLQWRCWLEGTMSVVRTSGRASVWVSGTEAKKKRLLWTH